MASIISAGTTSGTALNMSGDTTGILQLATNGTTTAVTIDTSQNVSINGALLAGTPGGAAGKVLALAATQFPQSIMTATSGTTGNKNIRFIYRDSGLFQLQTLDDTYGTEVTVHEVQRSTTGITYQAFYAGIAGSVAERMRIDSSGNLLVGTTSAPAHFVVSGQGGSNGWVQNNINTGTGAIVSLGFSNDNGLVGYVQTSGSSTTYVTSSDYRLKDNIVPMTGALAKVAQLKPVTYKWKVDNTQSQGFIAHELQEVVPECVTGTKDATREEEYEVTPAVKDEQGKITTSAVMGTRTVPAYQGVDTSFLVATLTAAMQEQQETITALTARIVALETV